ncbi:MAG: class I SAM-dependent methyltransferase [Saprospiraceae bacterium]|nr:class I SAM-dependent methyltransferase [Saprospiraceae bacterium]
MSDFVRVKQTMIEKPLPPPGQMLEGDSASLAYIDLNGREQVLDYSQLVQFDQMPMPMPIDREGYGTIELSPMIWATGHADWLNVCDAMKRHMNTEWSDQKSRLLDFGCASGRFLRHVVLFGRDQVDAWGCDFAPNNVQWVKRHLSSDFKVFLNTDVPHLPFPDGYFNVIVAFSVFTHINQFEDAWLLELRRITNDQGILYLTILNEASWVKVKNRPVSYDHITNANKFEGNIPITKELFNAPMPHDRIVFRMSKSNVYNCLVWHTSKYIHDSWSRYFEILEIANNAHGQYQSPVILRPR